MRTRTTDVILCLPVPRAGCNDATLSATLGATLSATLGAEHVAKVNNSTGAILGAKIQLVPALCDPRDSNGDTSNELVTRFTLLFLHLEVSVLWFSVNVKFNSDL